MARDDKPQILEDYDKHRAFYGCLDWHSAVNSTWMMISLIKEDPTIAVSPAIRNELASHFQKENIDGELAFFTKLKGQGADFEKPYGYAWLLKLYGELKTWNDPDGQRAATVLEPLAKWTSEQYVLYLHSLNYPVRVGLHPNTALDMVLSSTTPIKYRTKRLRPRSRNGDSPLWRRYSLCQRHRAGLWRLCGSLSDRGGVDVGES